MFITLGARIRILAYLFFVFGAGLLLWQNSLFDQSGFWLVLCAVLLFVVGRISDSGMHRAQKLTLSSIIDNIPTAIYLKDNKGAYQLSNRQFEHLVGKTREQIAGVHDNDLFDHERALRCQQDDVKVMQTEQVLEYEETITTKDGKCTYINKKFPIRKPDGKVNAVCGLLIDITEYKIATENFSRSSRAYKVMSRINSGMKHAASERGWLQDVCRYLVEIGGYRMAWIGIAQRGAGKFILPVADVGDDFNYLSSMRFSWSDSLENIHEPNSLAVRKKRAVTINDIAGEEPAAWRDEANRRGYMAMCSIPVLLDVKALGDDAECMVLSLYSTRHHTFDESEIILLNELAGDVGFGIRAMREHDENARSQIALGEEKQKFEQIVQGINAGVILLNAQGRIVWVNDQIHNWFGAQQDFRGMRCEQCMGVGSNEMDLIARDVMQSGESHCRSSWMKNERIGERYFDIVAAPLFNDRNELIQVVELIVDVTDKKMLEDERQKSDRQLRDAQRIARIGSWELNLKTGKLLWSDEVFRIFGMSQEKVNASYSAFLDVIHPDDRENVDHSYTESLKSNKPFEIVFRIRLKDGRIKYVHERCETEFDNKLGVAVRSLGTVQDITDQIVVEQALFESEEHYRRLIESSTAIPWEMNAATLHYLFVGSRAEKLLGISSDEWCHENFWLSHMHQEDRARVLQLYRHELDRGESFECEYRLVGPNGKTVWVRDNVNILRDAGKPVRLQGFMFDITEQRNAEEIARRTQKMDAVGQLTGGIAHDFNNQLGVIQGYLEFLKDYTRDKEKPQHWVDAATSATRRCIDLSRKLLDFSRKKAIAVESVNINSVMERMRDLIARSVTSRIHVNYQLENNLWLVAVNSGELEDTILNMVINSRDAMPETGQLTLATENLTITAELNQFYPGLEAGDYVQITIADTGVGINMEIRERIFEPFFTTKAEGIGTGLGLAMVYSFVKRSAGIVNLYSEPGEGSIFQIYLPRMKHDTDTMVPVGESEDYLSGLYGHGETILVVDDEEGLRDVASNYLVRLGYNTLEAENAEAALLILQTDIRVDLLFTDIVMPGMNGYQLAEKARQLRPQLKVLLTSGFTGNAAPGFGVDDLLLNKPYNKQELMQAVQSLLVDKSLSSDSSVVEDLLPVTDALTSTIMVSRKRLVVLDDEISMGGLVSDVAESMGMDAMHFLHAAEFIRRHTEQMDVLVLDLMLPDLDGVEMIRLLAGMESKVALILISGVDKSVLHSAEELAYEHKLNIIGSLQKPFFPHELKKMLSGIDNRRESSPAFRKQPGSEFVIHADELREGIEKKQFVAFFQPQISLQKMEVIGFEALMRWKHPTRGLIPPNLFIPLAEEAGLIDEMTWQLFDQVASDWQRHTLQQTVSLNMTAGMFKNLDLPDRLFSIGSRHAFVNNAQLVLEVTESALMGELTKSLDSLTRLRMKGFHLSIDDFGTGFSSMLQLYRAPFTELKIDQSFVMRMEKDAEASTIVESTINLAHNLNMKVVAEGVESESILRRLTKLGCDVVQGFHIARPMPIDDAMQWMRDWQNKVASSKR